MEFIRWSLPPLLRILSFRCQCLVDHLHLITNLDRRAIDLAVLAAFPRFLARS